jgi:hypothetical protein
MLLVKSILVNEFAQRKLDMVQFVHNDLVIKLESMWMVVRSQDILKE